ncbi:MAG: sugar ABC transporter ATP-binding protein, partial [bacterium]|nr:sugar ABC transporter ATP-binding protein [bacterium]
PISDFLVKNAQIDFAMMNTKARESLKLFDLDIPPDENMENLALAEQQMVEILRAISRKQNVILFDEPTSGLKAKEAERLMDILKQLRDDGITIIYISHRIPEIMNLSDRVTILRDGQYIATHDNTPELTENQLISGMVGREFSDSLYHKKDARQTPSTQVYLEVKGFTKKKSLQNVSFSVHEGEILGVFGLEGSGALDLSRQLYGLDANDSGELLLRGKALKRINPGVFIKKNVLYLNDNRKEAGLLIDMAASDNIALTSLKQVSKVGFFNKSRLGELTNAFIERFSIVIPSINTRPRNLSGGNQQKLMMAVCLATDPDCLIVNEPTRGVDVGAKVEIHKYILSLAEKGKSLIVFSSELPELIGLADRIIVMQNKQIAGELSGAEISEEKVMSYAAGSGIA